MNYWLLLTCCCWTVIVQAQDFRQDFMQVYQNYTTLPYYTQKVEVQSFARESSTQPDHQAAGTIVKRGSNYYSSMEGQHTIIKGKQWLHVNIPEKRMLYYEHRPDNHDAMAQYALLLDSIGAGEVTYLGSKGSIKRYTMNSPDHLIAKTELSLDMKRRVLAQVVYYYRDVKEHQSTLYKTIITYQMDSDTRPSNDWFDLSKYLQFEQQQARPRAPYQQYRLTQPSNAPH